MNAILMNLWRQ